MLTELTITGLALLALVFLSTVESAYEALSEVSLRVMAGEREEAPRARFFRRLLEQRQQFELILILGTQLSIGVITYLVAYVLITSGVRLPLLGTLVVVLLVILLFRQFIPRLLAQRDPEAVIWALLPAFRVIYVPLSMLVAPVNALLVRLREPEPEETEEEEDEEAHEEIQAFIDVGEEEGIIEESEGKLIQSIIELSDKRVAEVMRPRPQIVAIPVSATLADARRLMIESKYSRIPVYRDHIDNIEGIVYVRDLLSLFEPGNVDMPVTRCMRPAYFVPESKSVPDLLEEMQKAKVQISMVIDEYGGVAGLVTVEDIIEEIVGEIEDEDRLPSESGIVQAEDGSFLIEGSAEIRKVELLYDKEVEADDFTTVAGLIINELGHVPAIGEKLDFKGLEFEVVEADSKQVRRVRLRRAELPAAVEQEPGLD